MKEKNNNISIAEKFLEISKEDLEVSACLYYDKKKYAPAIYYLQQSAEKALKAYFVINGFEPEELHKPPIGHEPINQHILKGILMYRTGYWFRNFIVTQIVPHKLMKMLENVNQPSRSLIEKQNFNHNLKKDINNWGKDLKKGLSEISKTEKTEFEKTEKTEFELLEKDECILQEMSKGEILTYLHEIILPLRSSSIKESQPTEEDYTNMQNKLEGWEKDEEVRRDIDTYFLEAYGTDMENYFEDCYREIHDLYWISLEHEHKQQLNNENIDNRLKKEFKTNTHGHNLSNNAKVFKIDEKHWEIIDDDGAEQSSKPRKSLFLRLIGRICNTLKSNEKINKNRYRVRDVGTKLYVYKTPKANHQKLQNFFTDIIADVEKNRLYGNNTPLELMYLSLITGPHVSSTRYPKLPNDKGRLRYSDYKEGLGIVDGYGIIHEGLKYCIGGIEKIIDNTKIKNKSKNYKNESLISRKPECG